MPVLNQEILINPELSHPCLYWAVSSVSLLFMASNYWFFLFWAVSSVSLLLMTWISNIIFFELSHLYLRCLCHVIINFFIFWAVSSVSLLLMTCNYWFFFNILSCFIWILIVLPCNYCFLFELFHRYLYCLWHAVIDFIFELSHLYLSCLCHVIIDFFFIFRAVLSVS